MTAQELVTKSLETYRSAQAMIESFEKEKDNGVGSFAKKAPAEKINEVQSLLNEADNWKLQADILHSSDRLAKEAEELKRNPLRKFGFGADDENIRREVDYFKNFGMQNTTALKLDDPRFKWALNRAILGAPPIELKSSLESYIRFGRNKLEGAELQALTPLTDAEGGYLLTEEYRTEIIRKLRNLVHIRERATVIQTSAAAVAFPTFDPADTQTTMPQALPNAAIGQASLSNVFGKTQFVPHKRATIIPIPMELLEDAVVDVGALLTDFWALRMKEIEEVDFMTGSGVNQPYGLFGPLGAGFPNAQKQAIAGSTTAMAPEDLVKTVYGIREVYRTDAAWLMFRTVIQNVRLFRTNIGGAGTGSFMFQPSVQAGQPATLFGYPLLETEFAPNPYSGSLAAAGCAMAMFGNLKFYWIIDRIDLMVMRLNELYAANDQVGFRLRKRYDAAPILADPFIFMTRN